MNRFLLYILFSLVSLSSFGQGRMSQPKGNPNGLDSSAFSGIVFVTRAFVADDTFDAKTGDFINLQRKGVEVFVVDSSGNLHVINQGRISGALRLDDVLNFYRTDGIYILSQDLSDNAIIGFGNSSPTTGERWFVQGNSNTINPAGIYVTILGNTNTILPNVQGVHIQGHFNSIVDCDNSITINGSSNSVNFTSTSNNSRGVGVEGFQNQMLHPRSWIIGANNTTTSEGQFIAGFSVPSTNSRGFEYVYFGNGVYSTALDGHAGMTNICATGGEVGETDKRGGGVRIRNGIGTGAAIDSDVIIATTNAGTTGSTAHSMTDRWWVKFNTGTLSNVSNPPSNVVQYISSTTQFGHSTPVMTTAQRNAISSPAAGDEVYCSDCTADDASTGVKQTYNGSAWKNHW